MVFTTPNRNNFIHPAPFTASGNPEENRGDFDQCHVAGAPVLFPSVAVDQRETGNIAATARYGRVYKRAGRLPIGRKSRGRHSARYQSRPIQENQTGGHLCYVTAAEPCQKYQRLGP